MENSLFNFGWKKMSLEYFKTVEDAIKGKKAGSIKISAECKLSKVQKDSFGAFHVFVIAPQAKGRRYVFACGDDTHRTEWLMAVQELIASTIPTHSTPSSSHASSSSTSSSVTPTIDTAYAPW